MSLSNIDKNHLENLLLSINKDDDNGVIDIIKSNHVHYAKLQMLYNQMKMIQNEALNIINDAKNQNELHHIKKNFKLVSGNYYFLYQKENKEKYLSLISNEEWESNKDKYLGKYYYDYDKQFILN